MLSRGRSFKIIIISGAPVFALILKSRDRWPSWFLRGSGLRVTFYEYLFNVQVCGAVYSLLLLHFLLLFLRNVSSIPVDMIVNKTRLKLNLIFSHAFALINSNLDIFVFFEEKRRIEKEKEITLKKEKSNSRELSLTSLSTNVDHWISRDYLIHVNSLSLSFFFFYVCHADKAAYYRPQS